MVVWFQRAAEQLNEEVAAAVARFPSVEGKCTPEEEAAWRSEPLAMEVDGLTLTLTLTLP